MPEPGAQLVLPFAVIEREGGLGQEFPLAMTLATVLADIEKQREKAGVLRRREEALEFAALLYWPIIITPWRENRHLVAQSHKGSHVSRSCGVWCEARPAGRSR